MQFKWLPCYPPLLRKTGNWSRFTGCDKGGDTASQLRLFWSRWRVLRPNHQIFELRDSPSLERTLPVLLHGDEGRGAKRQGLMCLSATPILGHGVVTRSKTKTTDRSDSQLMNYVGHSFATRFLLGVMPKAAYENTPSVFQKFVSILADDFERLAKDGIICPVSGDSFFVGVLHVKGDWPFLVKIGELGRSFYNAPKRSSSKKPCTGICHFCLAGRPNFPYEDLRMDAEWQFTVGEEKPWNKTPAVFKIPHDPTFPEGFLAADPFHTWHLGEGRHFVANCVKLMMREAVGTNVDDKLDWLFADYKAFCRSRGRQCYAARFNANLFRIGNEFPTGSWTKGNFTTSLVKWVNHFLNSHRNSYPDGSDFVMAVACCFLWHFFFLIMILHIYANSGLHA